ncbi:MAG TPA: MarR family transcriptional regulator [Aliidongia sp.]|uniref:MarR family winged helix-turn-helix transcriptional regulator n=1 Tax=Aliidongia sp. TaxID=1914230 RepID=UPI002DDDB1C9|nr:MarR family transcriptional regulator [Aliidongia sp.]HEV2676775.1 MarR family transcriptional regulator [Aliidongia sp.]
MPLGFEAAAPDRESAVAEDDRLQLRLWLRLLTCTDLIENEVRGRLRSEFATSLPRFDVLAQLERARDGMTLSALSSRLMVSNGNVTGLVEGMVRDGLVERRANPADGRSALISSTAVGHALFARMAPTHQAWIDGLMGGMSRAEMVLLLELLGKLKQSVQGGGAWKPFLV